MSQRLFEKHLVSAIRKYPNLRIVGNPGSQFLKGILEVPDGIGGIATSYSIEIKSSPLYPYRYPLALEVGGDIPTNADNHKYSNNSLCLGVEAEEVVQCRNGLEVSVFIEKVLIPHLANQYYHHITGSYLQEYAHGTAGIRQYYEGVLGEIDPAIWNLLYNAAFVKVPERNDPCCCGSGRKFKRCHEVAVNSLKLIGKENVEKDFKVLNLL